MRTSILVIATLVVALIALVPKYSSSPKWLQMYCEDTTPERNHVRIRACRAILAYPDIEPWYRGAINTQLCVALDNDERWKEAIDACTKGNNPYPQYANYMNRALAHSMLGEHDQAEADLIAAAFIKPLDKPPSSQ